MVPKRKTAWVSVDGPRSRDYYLGRLIESLNMNRSVIVIGPPGTGKSTLALEAAYRSLDGGLAFRSSSIFWIDAMSDATLQKSFMDMFQRIRSQCFPDMSGVPSDKLLQGDSSCGASDQQARLSLKRELYGVLRKDDGTPKSEADRRLVLRFINDWLHGPDNKSWLLVFDGVVNAEATYLEEYLPEVQANRGYVIITSRERQSPSSKIPADEIELRPLNPSFMSPHRHDQGTSVPREVSSKVEIRVQALDSNESIKLMETTLSSDSQPPPVGHKLPSQSISLCKTK